jgi:hypothetical protein
MSRVDWQLILRNRNLHILRHQSLNCATTSLCADFQLSYLRRLAKQPEHHREFIKSDFDLALVQKHAADNQISVKGGKDHGK